MAKVAEGTWVLKAREEQFGHGRLWFGWQVMELVREGNQIRKTWPHLNPDGGVNEMEPPKQIGISMMPKRHVHNVLLFLEKYQISPKERSIYAYKAWDAWTRVWGPLVQHHTKLKPSCSLPCRHLASPHTTKPLLTLLPSSIYFFIILIVNLSKYVTICFGI